MVFCDMDMRLPDMDWMGDEPRYGRGHGWTTNLSWQHDWFNLAVIRFAIDAGLSFATIARAYGVGKNHIVGVATRYHPPSARKPWPPAGHRLNEPRS